MPSAASTNHSAAPRRTPPATLSGRSPSSMRVGLVDALRGFAVAMMIAFHFCYDLVWFGYARWHMLVDRPWVVWRTAIVTTFVFVVGISVVLRGEQRIDGRAFWRRWSQVAGAALLVSIVTWFQFGPRFVYFGILHFVAVAVLIGRVCRPLGAWNFLLGVAAVAVGCWWSHPVFMPRGLNWIGFAPAKPLTEDYVPVFPWIGVVLIGLASAQLAMRRSTSKAVTNERAPWFANTYVSSGLRWLGRRSLSIYLVHQPILIALIWAYQRLTH